MCRLEPKLHITLAGGCQVPGLPRQLVPTVDLLAEGSELVAALEGPSGRQPATSLLLLDASKSLDPDDPQGSSGALTFSWGCTRQDFPALCFQGSYQVGPRAVALTAVTSPRMYCYLPLKPIRRPCPLPVLQVMVQSAYHTPHSARAHNQQLIPLHPVTPLRRACSRPEAAS
jgi:hypothetical protein